MRAIRSWIRRLANIARRGRLEEDLRDELRFHLEARARDLEARGMSAPEARRQAHVEFGGIEGYKEQVRDAFAPRLLDNAVRDIRYGWRGLWRSPGLVAICVFSLGIGIGVNTTIVAAIRSILVPAPTVRDARTLVGVEPGNSNQMSFANYRDLGDSGIFEQVVGFRLIRANVRIDGSSEPVVGAAVSANFYRDLGIVLQQGRGFDPATDAPEHRPRVAVITATFWERRFNADPSILGRVMDVNGERVEIVGVLPHGYRSVAPIREPEVYVPISGLFLHTLDARINANGLTVLARLSSGSSIDHASMAVARWCDEMERRYPAENAGMRQSGSVFPLAQLATRGAPREAVLLPFAVLALFAIVLLIACGNVAGVLLARAAARRHETAVRAAIGAGRSRLIGGLIAEAFVLAAISAAAGLMLTVWATRLLSASPLPGGMAIRLTITPDATTAVLALALAIVTALVCGLAPALRACRVPVASILSAASTTRGPDRLRLRHAFIVGQVALSAFLVMLSIVAWRTAASASAIDSGFDIDRGLVARIALERQHTAEHRVALAAELIERTSALPGVQAASIANLVPLGGDVVVSGFEIGGREDLGRVRSYVNAVGPRYFETMGIPIVAGREFMATDRDGAPLVAIVTASFASRFGGSAGIVGRTIHAGPEPPVEIVGVAADSKFVSITSPSEPIVYYAFAQRPGNPILHVRTASTPGSSLADVRAVASAIDASAIVSVETLRQAAGVEVMLRRGAGLFLGALGGMGLLLALIGLYGVVSYTVNAGSGEIGLRMALGASSPQILRLFVMRAVTLVTLGAIVGVTGSFAVTIPARTFLAGVNPADPAAIAAATSLLLLSGACASYFPARRASRIDPLVALRG